MYHELVLLPAFTRGSLCTPPQQLAGRHYVEWLRELILFFAGPVILSVGHLRLGVYLMKLHDGPQQLSRRVIIG